MDEFFESKGRIKNLHQDHRSCKTTPCKDRSREGVPVMFKRFHDTRTTAATFKCWEVEYPSPLTAPSSHVNRLWVSKEIQN